MADNGVTGIGNAGDDARVLGRHPLNGEKIASVEVDARSTTTTT